MIEQGSCDFPVTSHGSAGPLWRPVGHISRDSTLPLEQGVGHRHQLKYGLTYQAYRLDGNQGTRNVLKKNSGSNGDSDGAMSFTDTGSKHDLTLIQL
ncbi:hypothetical protein MRX96_047268 [Rhipicephalus microplus]